MGHLTVENDTPFENSHAGKEQSTSDQNLHTFLLQKYFVTLRKGRNLQIRGQELTREAIQAQSVE